MTITPRQLDTLTYVRDYRYKHGISPTLQDIADHLAVSKVTASEHVKALRKRGAIESKAHCARTIELTEAGLLLVPPIKKTRLCWPILGTIGGVN